MVTGYCEGMVSEVTVMHLIVIRFTGEFGPGVRLIEMNGLDL